MEAGDSVVTWDTFHERTLWSLGTATTSVLHRHGWGGKWVQSPRQPLVGSQPRPVRTREDPGGRRAGTGRGRAGHGAPATGRCANQALSPPRSHGTRVGPETPQLFPAAGRVGPLASNAQALPTATPAQWEVGPCGGLCEAGRPGGRTVLPVAAGKEDCAAGTDHCRTASWTGLRAPVHWGEQPSPEEKDHRTLYHLSSQGSRLLGRAPQILRKFIHISAVVKQPLPPSPFLGLSHTAKLNFSPLNISSPPLPHPRNSTALCSASVALDYPGP